MKSQRTVEDFTLMTFITIRVPVVLAKKMNEKTPQWAKFSYFWGSKLSELFAKYV